MRKVYLLISESSDSSANGGGTFMDGLHGKKVTHFPLKENIDVII